MPAILIDLSGYDEDASDPHAPAPAQQMTSKTATRLLYLAFGLFIVASMTFFVMQTTAAFQELTHRGEHARMPFQVDDDLLTISNLEHEALAAGFKPGDRLLEIRGEPYRQQASDRCAHRRWQRLRSCRQSTFGDGPARGWH